MIKFAEKNNLNELQPIWKACFSVDFYSPYGVFYICSIFQNYKTLVYVKNNKIVSMLTLLPAKLLINGQNYNGLYIWGVGTLKDYRNQNITSEMLLFVQNYSKKNNIDFNFLVPQNYEDNLYKFYSKRGFNLNAKHKIVLLSKTQMEGLSKNTVESLKFDIGLSNSELMKLRLKNFSSCYFIYWDEDELDKVQKEYSLPENKHIVFNFYEAQYAIIDFRNKHKLVIREMFINKVNFKKFVRTLLETYKDYNLFEFSLPNNSEYFDCLNIDFYYSKVAMIKQINNDFNMDEDKVYFNFELDT